MSWLAPCAALCIAAAAHGQPATLTLNTAGAYLERGFCTASPQPDLCPSCTFAGVASGAAVVLHGSASSSPETACTSWTFHAAGGMSGNLLLGQRLRLTYSLTDTFTGSTARLASISIGGSHGAADAVAAGAGPTQLASGLGAAGIVTTPTFATTAAAGGTWNVEFEIDWTPSAPGASMELQIPAGGIQIDLIGPGVACPVDINADGAILPDDVASFVSLWYTSLIEGSASGDFDHNGSVQPSDIALFVQQWLAAIGSGGC